VLTAIRYGALAVVVAATLAGCANPSAVRWDTYNPAVRTNIAVAVATRDCAALEALLTMAKQTSSAHQSSTGYSNDDLVAFIEAAQRKVGCQ
jgi:hypothetical protein